MEHLCHHKEACQLLVAGCEAPLSTPADNLCTDKQAKIIAAPGLPPDQMAALSERCDAQGIRLIASNLRDHLAGIDIGLTYADFGIADTGTIGLTTNEGNARLVTTLPRVHVALIGLDKLTPSLHDALRIIRALPRNAIGRVALEFPMELSCCGLPVQMMGEKSAARDVALQNMATVDQRQYDYIVTLCASCASHLKHGYPQALLRQGGLHVCTRHRGRDLLRLRRNLFGQVPPDLFPDPETQAR